MKILAKSLALSFLVLFLAVTPALAATPNLSATYQGNNVQITVSNANSFASVNLSYRQSSSLWTMVNNIGQTDQSGYFSQSFSLPPDGSSSSVQMYVVVGGLQSSTISVYPNGSSGSCTYNCGSPTGISLSQNNLSLNVGQSSTVTIYTNGSLNYNNSYYISSNSNSSVATASISGNSVYVYANQSGSTNINICQSGNSFACAGIFVTVGSNNNGSITLNQSNVTLNVGQNAYVTVYSTNSNNNFYISSNSNSSVVSASVSGSQVTLYGLANGSSTISICANSYSACVSLFVTVNGNNYCGGYICNSGSLTLSPSSLNLYLGQSSIVTITQSSNSNYYYYSYYVSNNSNPSVANASISGGSVTVMGNNPGNTTLTICQNNNSNSCASLYVTVNNNYNCGYYGCTNNGGGLQYPGGGVQGANTYANGSLILENGTVYIVYKNTKSGFASASAFTGLGYKFSNVLKVSNSGLVQTNYIITTSATRHPWGSWIKSGSTIYFVHDQGLIPIPDWNTFLNNGGQASLVVPANTWDFRMLVLSPMVYNDQRLK